MVQAEAWAPDPHILHRHRSSNLIRLDLAVTEDLLGMVVRLDLIRETVGDMGMSQGRIDIYIGRRSSSL